MGGNGGKDTVGAEELATRVTEWRVRLLVPVPVAATTVALENLTMLDKERK